MFDLFPELSEEQFNKAWEFMHTDEEALHLHNLIEKETDEELKDVLYIELGKRTREIFTKAAKYEL